jgi:branched-chain amino acid transport system substrate-binding protein
MKRNSFIFLILFFVLASVFNWSCNNKSKEETIKIGAILPLTGNLASYGVDTKKALELAVSEINAQKGINGKKVVLIFEDSQGSSKLATTSINKLIDINKVQGILGPITSPEVLAIAPIANSKKVPIISPSSTDVDISNAGEYVFRTINTDHIETIAFSNFVKKQFGCISIGIIANRASGTLSYANSFEKYYTSLDCPINIKERYQENTKDFKTNISKLLNKDIQGIYVSGVSMEIGTIVRQIREFNKDIQIFSYQSAEDRRVVEIAGDAVDNMYFSSTTLPKKYLGKEREIFETNFKNKYGTSPGIFAPEIYDGINILLDAIAKSEENGVDMIDYLKNTKAYKGASGTITFDEFGDVHKAIAIYKYENTTPEPLFVVENDNIIPLD